MNQNIYKKIIKVLQKKSFQINKYKLIFQIFIKKKVILMINNILIIIVMLKQLKIVI